MGVGKQLYMNQAILDMLQRLPVFNMFSEDEIRRMLYSGEFVSIERYTKGDTIIQEGSYGKWVYVLMRGALRVVKGGTELCVLKRQGEIIGEMGAVKNQARTASVIANTDAVLIAINISVIEHMNPTARVEYLDRLRGFFQPLMDVRIKANKEISELLTKIREKEGELADLRERLRILGASEEKSLIQLILEDSP